MRPGLERIGQREAGLLFVVATMWFLPGITWGLPENSALFTRSIWGTDELGPTGAIDVVRAIFGGDATITPQYPLGHYFVQAIFVWPYYLAVQLADRFGFPAQTPSPSILTLLHRLPSVLMAAGTVVASAMVVQRVTRRVGASRFTAIAAATIGPLMYYGRTSNVDAAALFWSTLALLPAVDALRLGLTDRRAVQLGLCAALGMATKDQQYAYFLMLGAVLFVQHVRAGTRPAAAPGGWRPVVVALTVFASAYVACSGALLLPEWYAQHLAFIRHGSSSGVPAELRARIGFYYSNPGTLAGYTRLGLDGIALVLAAVGALMCALALLGASRLWRVDRWLLALLVMPLVGLIGGVFVPVRFVLPRFLLPIDLVCCLLAGIGVAQLLASARWRSAGQLTAIGALAWSVVRAGDTTWQMLRDARYETELWLARNLRPGDTLAYYGGRRKLPRVRRDVLVTKAPDQYLPLRVYGSAGPITHTPPFIIVIPQQVAEVQHEWNVPDTIFTALLDGTRGYRQVLAIQSPALFPRPRYTVPFVNAPVRVFARNDMADRLTGVRRIDLPPRVPTPR